MIADQFTVHRVAWGQTQLPACLRIGEALGDQRPVTKLLLHTCFQRGTRLPVASTLVLLPVHPGENGAGRNLPIMAFDVRFNGSIYPKIAFQASAVGSRCIGCGATLARARLTMLRGMDAQISGEGSNAPPNRLSSVHDGQFEEDTKKVAVQLRVYEVPIAAVLAPNAALAMGANRVPEHAAHR